MTQGTKAAKTLTATKIVELLVPTGDSPRVVVLAGLPASGKSTFSEGLTGKGFTRLSLDQIRKEIYGDESIIGDYKVTRKRFDELYNAALAAKENIVIDNTHFMRSHRKRVLDMAEAAGYTDRHIVVMNVSLEECLKRNAKRSRVVGEDIIRQMHGSLYGKQFPSAEEGTVTVLAPTADRNEYEVTGYVAEAA